MVRLLTEVVYELPLNEPLQDILQFIISFFSTEKMLSPVPTCHAMKVYRGVGHTSTF